ncbi:MAG: radical SAM protein [Candidatus Sumerlaeota bacterium]|nr:radical SAM protein [Candidatus Sumerlaeota bacterium]
MLSLKKIANAALSWSDHALRRTRLRAWPLRIHLEVNDFCNLACPMCSRNSAAIPRNTGHMDVRIVEALRPALRKAINVGLAGNGEPFLHPRLFDILDIVTSEGVVPSVLSNCTLIGEEAAARLIRYGPMILMASIDGGTKEVFEIMRRPALFETARENLMGLRRAKEKARSPFPIVHFLVTLCRVNEMDLPNIVRLAAQVGAPCVSVQTCYPYSEEARRQRIEDPARLEAALARGAEAARALGIRFDSNTLGSGLGRRMSALPEDHPFRGIEREGRIRLLRSPDRPAALYCPNIWTQMHVLINGDVRMCCFSVQKTVGNVLKQSLDEIWNHPAIQGARRMMLEGRIPSDCPECHRLIFWDEARPVAGARRQFIQTLKE